MDNVLTAWLRARFDEVEPREFYRTIFPAGELEQKGEYVQGRYTGIVVAVTGRKKWRDGRLKSEIKRYSMTDDLGAVDVATASDDFCLCSPLSYAGKSRTAEHARFMYAMAVDVDMLQVDRRGDPVGLSSLWERHIERLGRVPRPTFIVSSGSGIHLYYVYDRPVALFRETVVELQEYKRELTRLIWHDTIVNIRSVHDIQQEGIYQGFRMPGTVTKQGGRAVAFLTGDRVTVEYMNQFVVDRCQVKTFTYKSKLTRAEAADKYPEWYERRVVRKEPRGAWALNRAVYDWWLEKIRSGATVGHRYYCMMTLAIYARKCGQYNAKQNPNPVTRDELERDCFGLVEMFDSMTTDDNNHFDNDDVLDALEAYDDRWLTFPRSAVEYRSGIAIPANRRNGRDQLTHLRIARATQAIIDPDGEWRQRGGRKSKRDQVIEWRLHHPDGSKADCVRDTGMDRKTVTKHWD